MEEKFMRYAIELAKRGIGCVNPNPLVGAVIVKDGKIIGEGWHKRYGDWHAEVNAFNNAVEDTVAGAEMYVTLEPCSHYGKTPPCAEAIIRHKIRKVYVGMKDPNPLVSGKGIQMLQSAGVEVVVGVLEDECRAINPIFLKYIKTGLPYVVMKTAMSLDGKIACYTGESKWITCEESRAEVHKIRNILSAIMVGVNTVLEDNPYLTCRMENGRNPIRIVVDSHLKTPPDANVIENGNCIIATISDDTEKIRLFENMGLKIIVTKSKAGRVDLNDLMQKLGEMKIDSILLEGGGTLNYSALESGIVDKIISYISPKIIGGCNAKTPVEGIGFAKINECMELENIEIAKVGSDVRLCCDVRGR